MVCQKLAKFVKFVVTKLDIFGYLEMKFSVVNFCYISGEYDMIDPKKLTSGIVPSGNG